MLKGFRLNDFEELTFKKWLKQLLSQGVKVKEYIINNHFITLTFD